MSEATQAALQDRYATLATALRGQLLELLLRLFSVSGSWRDADAQAFVEQAAPAVEGAQQQMSLLTEAFLAAALSDMFGGSAEPRGVQLPQPLRGVPLPEVYLRPFVTVWTALAGGKDLTTAIREGAHRLESIASTDLQLARTHTVQKATQGDRRARYFRRVLRGSYDCALCVLASTQRYSKGELMPIHPGCDCSVEPLPGDVDPGQIIDPKLLEAAHAAVTAGVGESDRGGRSPDYRDVIITRQHGELGPLLAVRRHDFTGPSDLPGSVTGTADTAEP